MTHKPGRRRRREPTVADELQWLARQGQPGDAAALPRIREILDQHPEIWQQAGDISAVVEQGWIAALAGKDVLARESMTRTVAAMKRELAGDRPTRLVQMLADQAVFCWLELAHLQIVSAAARPDASDKAGAAIRVRALESAQKRYLAAVIALKDLAKSAPPGPIDTPAIRVDDADHESRATV